MAAPNGTTANGDPGDPTSPPPSSMSSTVPLFLNGAQITTASTFDVTSPLTHSVLYQCSSASRADATAAVSSCAAAFPAWAATKPSVKRDIFLRAAALMEARQEEWIGYMREETGAERGFSEFVMGLGLEACKDAAGLCMQALEGRAPTLAGAGRSAIVFREPYGVVLGIAPWNAPYALGLRACLLPLAAGNTVVLKGPELSPRSFWALARVLHDAGLPPGVLNTVMHAPGPAAQEVTEALISDPRVKKVSFTGSTAVGSIIAAMAGKYVKPVLMELGGKAPSIVCADADLGHAAMQCALGAFLHSGQVCMSTERILVHAAVAAPFKLALKAAVAQVFGPGDAPALVNAPAVARNQTLLRDAVGKGAQAVYGDVGDVVGAADDPSPTRMRPVVIEGVTPAMAIYHTESFGPTVSLIVVESDEEAVRVANDTEYGLSSAVFTRDLRRGLQMARQMECGAVHINGMTVHDEAALPHGGVKKSGFGRFNGREGLDEWVRTKTVTWMD